MNPDAALFCIGCGAPFGDVEIPYTEPEQNSEIPAETVAGETFENVSDQVEGTVATVDSEAPTFDDFVTYVPV